MADFDGLLRPGDRVDVLLTQGGKDSVGSTITLLQNLVVLAVGGSTIRGEDAESSKFARGSSVTVSVTVQQAQVLTQARERGRLTLSLRSAGDITLVEGVPETTARDLAPSDGTSNKATTSNAKGGI